MAYTKDALWFYPVFDAAPAQITIRCYGEQVILERDSEHLPILAGLVNEQISEDKRWDELNLTDPTYQDYQTTTSMMILEFSYSEPQRIHSRSPFFSGFTALLIPLDGRYSSTNIMFALRNGKPAGGSFHVRSFEATRSYIEDNNLCVKP
ncbi:MAG: hypothetical protein IT314_04765 [Anaerolineales bacterium]|nr:hypothetical protein [Anaerolineales bacterium]